MKAIITEVGEITPQYTRFIRYNICNNKGDVLLSNQSVESRPSQAKLLIKAKLDEFEQEYERVDLEVGMEIK